MRFNATRFAATLLVAACATATAGRAAAVTQDDLRDTVTRQIAPLMKQYAIPGMAIGIVADGKPYVFDYGVMSKQTGKPVTGD
ncbi:serine hydrolase, partial [Rothia dentocariosa]